MIQATITGNNVVLTADNESRQELISGYRQRGYMGVEQAVAEALHERWEFVRPEEIGALTDSPLLAECDGIVRDDAGELTAVGRVCWFPDYAITDPWFELAKHGTVTFPLSPDDARAAA